MPTIAELGMRVKQRYPGEYDDMSDQELGLRVKAKYPEYADFTDTAPESTQAAPQTAAPPSPSPSAPEMAGGGQDLKELLPVGGGFAGAMAGAQFSPQAAALGTAMGGPVGGAIGGSIPPIVGAFVGAAGLEAWRQNIDHLIGNEAKAPGSSIEALQRMAQEGGEQAQAEIGGRLLLGTTKKFGQGLMQAALRTSPEIAKIAIKEGITATKMGLEKLDKLWSAVTKEELRIAGRASRSGVRISVGQDIANPAFDEVAKRFRGAPVEVRRKLVRLHNRFIASKTFASPSSALYWRKYYDEQARNQWLAREGGKRGAASIEELWAKAVADKSREALQKTVPTIADPETYRQLVGRPVIPHEVVQLKNVLDPIVKRAPSLARKTVERTGPAAAGAGIGVAITPENRTMGAARGAAVGAGTGMLFSPQVLSWLAHVNNPALNQFLLNLPRLVGASSAVQEQR